MRLPLRDRAAYAAFAVPLAMAALPVYVHVPKFYAEHTSLALATIGAILFATRGLDALVDPWIGRLSDRAALNAGGRQGFVVAAVACLGLGMVALFHPFEGSALASGAWLVAALVVTYLGFSIGTIAYFAWGAALSSDYHERTRITAIRSAFGLAGVLTAAALPSVLGGEPPAGDGLAAFSLLYVPLLVLLAGVTLFGAPTACAVRGPGASVSPPAPSLFSPLRNLRFRWLLAVFLASGVASAIPGVLILFYVEDVLGRPDLSGVFLGLYFLFGAAGMPWWVKLSQAAGKKRAWLFGMAMSIAAFIGAYALGPGDIIAFGIVCALSGIAYGAELALPASILADVVDADAEVARGVRPDGAYFGFWQFTEKLNLALAAGIALPLLGWVGYETGRAQPALGVLSMTYALLPCLLKVVAVAVLWRAPLEPGAPPFAVRGALP